MTSLSRTGSFALTIVSPTRARAARGVSLMLLAGAAAACGSDEGTVERDATAGDAMSNAAATDGAMTDGTTTVVESVEAAAMDAESQLPGTGPNLTVVDGWVANNTNGVGIQGAFFTYGDPSGRTTIAEDVGGSASGYCVSGESGQVIDEDFGGTWGAVAALNLRQPVGVETAGAYNARTNGVVGFGFEIVGTTGGLLRFVSKQFNVHDGFCETTEVPDCGEGCSVEVLIANMTQNCWDAGGVNPRIAEMSAIEWQITTSTAGPTPFNYCIENIQAIMGNIAD